MKGIVDRFEGDYCIIEIDGQTRDIPRSEVDSNVRDGDVVILVNGVWKADQEETQKRSEQIRKMMDSVWGD